MTQSRKHFLKPVLIVVVGLLSTPALTAQTDEKPVGAFTVEATDLNLGIVAAGTDAVATFVFRNDTDKAVKIIRAKPS